MVRWVIAQLPSILSSVSILYQNPPAGNKNPGALMSQIGNNDMTWEKTFTTGIGLDLGMF